MVGAEIVLGVSAVLGAVLFITIPRFGRRPAVVRTRAARFWSGLAFGALLLAAGAAGRNYLAPLVGAQVVWAVTMYGVDQRRGGRR